MYKGRDCISRPNATNNAWTKEELLSECISLKLPYKTSFSKAQLCELLNNSATSPKGKQSPKVKISKVKIFKVKTPVKTPVTIPVKLPTVKYVSGAWTVAALRSEANRLKVPLKSNLKKQQILDTLNGLSGSNTPNLKSPNLKSPNLKSPNLKTSPSKYNVRVLYGKSNMGSLDVDLETTTLKEILELAVKQTNSREQYYQVIIVVGKSFLPSASFKDMQLLNQPLTPTQQKENITIRLNPGSEDNQNLIINPATHQLTLSDDKYILSTYDIKKILGKGSYGTIYLVSKLTDPTNKLMALKLIRTSKSMVGTQLLEIKFLEKLSNEDTECYPYITCYYSHHTSANLDKIYVEMEYVAGGDLLDYANDLWAKKMNEQLIELGLTVMKYGTIALNYVHAHGILHQDIKPENIFLTPDLIPKLGDFGLGCNTKPADTPQCLRPYKHRVGPCCMYGGGTDKYLPPEFLLYSIRYPQSDIWSLAATVYTIVTGKRVWGTTRADLGSMQRAAHTFEMPTLDTSNALLNEVVTGALRKDIAQRLTGPEIEDMLRDI